MLSNMPVSATYADGFAPRYHSFVRALSEVAEVDVVEVMHRDWQQFSHPPDPSTGARRVVRHAGWHAASQPGLPRRRQFLLGRYPTRTVDLPAPLLREELARSRPDLLVVLSPDLAPTAFRAGVPAVYVLDEAWERSLSYNLRWLPRWKQVWLGWAETRRYRALYRGIRRRGGTVVAIADHERDWLAPYLDDIVVLPHAIDTSYFAPVDAEPDVDVLVLGHLGQPRNLEPTLEYVRAVEAARPLRWALVGGGTPDEIRALASDRIEVPGYVEDVRPWYARARLVTVPSFVGTGVKTTLLQAWATGRPALTTSFGTRGVPARPGENVAVADDVPGLVAETLRLLDDEASRARLAAAGRETVVAERDVRVVARRFAELCLERAR